MNTMPVCIFMRHVRACRDPEADELSASSVPPRMLPGVILSPQIIPDHRPFPPLNSTGPLSIACYTTAGKPGIWINKFNGTIFVSCSPLCKFCDDWTARPTVLKCTNYERFPCVTHQISPICLKIVKHRLSGHTQDIGIENCKLSFVAPP
ncbi:hypothetical protein IQ07DRAFT_389145 [Pyrenochaeta sp. DS3sAY3a]|nr:hypothetical protein IQ07DRAFT_389145 [Pyrenochaeta sp. DS3sAY3a]